MKFKSFHRKTKVKQYFIVAYHTKLNCTITAKPVDAAVWKISVLLTHNTGSVNMCGTPK